MSFWPSQQPERSKYGPYSATRTNIQIPFTRTNRNRWAQRVAFNYESCSKLRLWLFALSDPMLERHQLELLFAKSTDRANCVRQILANLWCGGLYRFVQCNLTVGRTLAGRRFSRPRPCHFMVGWGQRLSLSIASKVSWIILPCITPHTHSPPTHTHKHVQFRIRNKHSKQRVLCPRNLNLVYLSPYMVLWLILTVYIFSFPPYFCISFRFHCFRLVPFSYVQFMIHWNGF